MASHPYISGAGNITQMISLLRKNFPTIVTSDTVKKYGLAPKNESYVINALQFIGIIDEEGKRTDQGSDAFSLHSDEEFAKAFGDLVRKAYSDLFDLRGDDAWTLSKQDLIGYFRTTDKTSDVIGTRQAGVFRAFAALAGHNEVVATTRATGAVKSKAKTPPARAAAKSKKSITDSQAKTNGSPNDGTQKKREMALTVRIEINLPAEGTRETYDNIFQSIKANLLDE